MTHDLQPGRGRGALLLADISGYTAFLEDVRHAHQADAFADGRIPDAYAFMSALLDGIATRVEPPFTVAKLEGDAVFAVAPDAVAPRGLGVLACVQACYADFADRLAKANDVWTCTCQACARIDTLDLKFVLHYGEYVVQAIGRHVEVLGPEVTLAHRLLKNRAAEVLGSRAYALFTDDAADALDLPLPGAARLTEQYEHVSQVRASVVPLPVAADLSA
jgi:class 3 adenylate cyclase